MDPACATRSASVRDPHGALTRCLRDQPTRRPAPRRRYIVSTPPRTGKSLLTSVVAPVFALASDPDAQVIVSSYADTLAEEHSREARRLIAEHGEALGIELAQDKSAVGRWRVAGRRVACLQVESFREQQDSEPTC